MKKTYSNDKIEVNYDPQICTHSTVCIRSLHSVFNYNARPWINLDGADTESVINVIKKCPSGALTYKMKNDMEEVKIELNDIVNIEVTEHGPIRIRGKVIIRTVDGKVIRETEKCSLCGCGMSKKRPFCDSTHKTIEMPHPLELEGE